MTAVDSSMNAGAMANDAGAADANASGAGRQRALIGPQGKS
ncbi:MAG: hypothetical protein P0Y64_10175 [Candidatus Sphingomonas colombiensis]|nr:hypothetical protein [Sphingomonas sp.]WEK41778.1 MAG: hypothetical protein P0Y64_10175 [Sphingomonas sp.]